MKRGIKIPVRGPLEVIEYDDDLDAICTAIDAEPGYIERVRVGQTEALAVHESGRLIGLPENPRAGVLYGTPTHGQPIVGTAVYLWEGMGDDGVDFIDIADVDRAMEDLYGRFIVHGIVDTSDEDDHHEPKTPIQREVDDIRTAVEVLRKESSPVSIRTADLLVDIADRAEAVADTLNPRFSGMAEVVAGNLPGYFRAVALAREIVRDRAE